MSHSDQIKNPEDLVTDVFSDAMFFDCLKQI
ncbi:hypothetical protein ANRL2_03807 [Anaerolineae bacterium]|nr:hypothetical protein ANRL2_03807 [Anaerolineae bacterium]